MWLEWRNIGKELYCFHVNRRKGKRAFTWKFHQNSILMDFHSWFDSSDRIVIFSWDEVILVRHCAVIC